MNFTSQYLGKHKVRTASMADLSAKGNSAEPQGWALVDARLSSAILISIPFLCLSLARSLTSLSAARNVHDVHGNAPKDSQFTRTLIFGFPLLLLHSLEEPAILERADITAMIKVEA